MNRSNRQLTVTTGSRLHFGLFSVGQIEQLPQFGGCGLMTRLPINQVTIQPALSSPGKTCPTLEKLVRLWQSKLSTEVDFAAIEEIVIQTRASAPRHNGFGSGTQMALAVGLALSKWFELALDDAEQMGRIMERGLRSAIGTHGFFRGGFLVDRGKREQNELASLDLNCEFPEHWPVLILNLKTVKGVHGAEEIAAFRAIPHSSRQHRERMIEMVKKQIAPAVLNQDYEQFGDAIFEYGRSSGSVYASVQGGDFHSQPVEELVYQVREFGVAAVGQSSWGPCVFAIANDSETASSLQQFLLSKYGDALEITVTRALNHGVEAKWQDLE